MDQEKVILKASFNPSIKTYFFVLGCFILFVTIIGWPILVIWVIALGKYWTNKQYDALECELRENTLHFKKGVLVTLEKTIPLENIQDLTFKEGPLLRYFGLAILQIETAGGQGSGAGGDLTLIGINDAKNFREEVLIQRQLVKGRGNNPQENHAFYNQNTEILKEISTTLKNIEVALKKK